MKVADRPRRLTAEELQGASRGPVVDSMAMMSALAAAPRSRRNDNPDRVPPSFAAAKPPPGVLPKKEEPGYAFDELAVDLNTVNWAAESYASSAFAEGVTFIGYSYLAALTQRPEYRVVSEEIASEMTREWIELVRAGEDEKSDRVKKLEEAVEEKYKLRDVFRKVAEHDGFFGRGQIYLDTGDTDDGEELKKPIGNGYDEASRAKVGKGALRGVRTVEPVWTYPAQYNSTDPLKDDWYRPETWYVMGKEVHRTRLLTFVGREMPDILKPAYAFGGLAMSQMIKPYVDNWLRTRQAVADLIKSFSVSGLKTNLAATLQLGGDKVMNRVQLFNLYRDNAGAMILDKDAEEWFNVVTPLGGLHELQAQAQEHMASIARVPLVKLLGIQPSGLNASSEGEIRSFYDWIKAFQNLLFYDHLVTILGFVQLSEFGEVDPAIRPVFKDLWQLDEGQKTDIEQKKAQTHQIYLDAGVVDETEVREAVANDKDSPYAGLDLSGEAPGPPEPPGGGGPGGLLGPGGGGPPDDEPPDPEGEGEGEDNAEISTWRRRVETLFSDPKELARWTDRARELFEAERPSRWAAAAASLFATSTEPATLLQWIARVDELRESWSDLAARIPRNVVTEPVVPESFAAGGSDRARWVDKRWDAWSEGAFDAGEWSEESHPRDPKGKFAKAGTGHPKVVQQLEEAGYEKHPDFPKSEIYHHPETGHHVGFVALTPSQAAGGKKQTVVKHLPPKGKPSGNIWQKGALASLLGQLHGGGSTAAAKSEPAASPEGEFQKKFTSLSDEGDAAGQKLEELGWKAKSPADHEVQHFAKEGIDVFIAPEGAWSIWSSAGSKINSGSNPLDIPYVKMAALKSSGQEVGGGQVEKEEAASEKTSATATSEQKEPFGPDGLKPPKGIESTGVVGTSDTSGKVASYEMPSGGILKMFDDGSWDLGGNQLGEGQEALDKAFEALHPRGPGGKFAKKPGADIPDPVPIPEGWTNYEKKEKLKFGNVTTYTYGNGWKLWVNGSGNVWSLTDKDGDTITAGSVDQISELTKYSPTANPSDPTAAPEKPPGSIAWDKPVVPDAMKKVGEQKGSNPGGVYEDEAGDRYYVKKAKSADHARNELLAATLYQLAGAPTLDYHPSLDGGHVATRWQELKVDNVKDLTPAQRKAARLDFATHAWLANWDAAGLSNDNIGASESGKHVNLDLGGALQYRAKGEPKGAAFGDEVGEWTSLRSSSKNPTAAALFKDLTAAEIAESVGRVAALTNDQIITAVNKVYPNDDSGKAALLAHRLIKRRDDVIAKSKAEFGALSNPATSQTIPAQAASPAPPQKTAEQVRAEIAAKAPPRSKAVVSAINDYKGSGYIEMNNCARHLVDCDDPRVQEIEGYIAKAKMPAATLYRGVKADYAGQLLSVMKPGRKIRDLGFVSTSTQKSFSRNWAGSNGLLFVIDSPEGAHGVAVRPKGKEDGEYEILLQRESHFVVTHVDYAKKEVHVKLEQPKHGVGA